MGLSGAIAGAECNLSAPQRHLKLERLARCYHFITIHNGQPQGVVFGLPGAELLQCPLISTEEVDAQQDLQD